MLIKIGYDIELAVSSPIALVHLLRVHPSRRDDHVAAEIAKLKPVIEAAKQFAD